MIRIKEYNGIIRIDNSNKLRLECCQQWRLDCVAIGTDTVVKTLLNHLSLRCTWTLKLYKLVQSMSSWGCSLKRDPNVAVLINPPSAHFAVLFIALPRSGFYYFIFFLHSVSLSIDFKGLIEICEDKAVFW